MIWGCVVGKNLFCNVGVGVVKPQIIDNKIALNSQICFKMSSETMKWFAISKPEKVWVL